MSRVAEHLLFSDTLNTFHTVLAPGPGHKFEVVDVTAAGNTLTAFSSYLYCFDGTNYFGFDEFHIAAGAAYEHHQYAAHLIEHGQELRCYVTTPGGVGSAQFNVTYVDVSPA